MVVLNEIQDAITKQQCRSTPMQVLESLSMVQENAVKGQLSRTLIMKGWRCSEEGLRRRAAEQDIDHEKPAKMARFPKDSVSELGAVAQ